MTNLPPQLKENPKFWFLKKAFHQLHPPYNKHFAAVVASESGGGKSYSTISCASAIYPEFDPQESIAFDARRFLEIASKGHPSGFPIILDDAGLTAFSGDALTKEVGAISKIAQSIRYKNWQVYLNLPSLDLLAKSVRITNHYYMEPVWIDYLEQDCFCKFQRIRVNPKGGDKMIFQSPRKWVKTVNEITGYDELKKGVFHTVPIPHPPKDIANTYELLKDENMKKFREETRIELERRHEVKMRKRPRTTDVLKILKEHPESFIKDGKINVGMVAVKFNIPTSTAYQLVKAAKDTNDF